MVIALRLARFRCGSCRPSSNLIMKSTRPGAYVLVLRAPACFRFDLRRIAKDS